MRRKPTIGQKVLSLVLAPGLLRVSASQALTPCAGTQSSHGPGCAVVREIDDPSTGQHWLLMRDPAHPGGPGVLALRDSVRDVVSIEGAVLRLHPVIRAGDRLKVEQSSDKVEVQLDGIALSPAALGAAFRVRLGISGRVVQAVAVSPGRALQVEGKDFWQ